MNFDPTIEEFMSLFTYEQLPKHLQEVSKPLCDAARHLNSSITNNQFKLLALQKLMEAKNYAVQAKIASQREQKVVAE